MPQGEDEEVLIRLEVGQNKHCVQGRAEQRQMAGTRGVSCKCLHDTILQVVVIQTLAATSLESKPNCHSTSRTQAASENVYWLCDSLLSP